MFDIAWSELTLVAVVAAFVLGPEELPAVVKVLRSAQRKLQEWKRELAGTLDALDQEGTLRGTENDLKSITRQVNQDIRTITDDQGREWEAYSLADIQPELDEAKRKRDEETGTRDEGQGTSKEKNEI